MAVSAGPSGRPASGRRCRVDTPWRPYAGAGPTSQARARLKYATTPPAQPPPFLFPSSSPCKPRRRNALPSPPRASSSSRALVTAPRLVPSRPRLHHHLLDLVHLIVEPDSQGRGHISSFSTAERHYHCELRRASAGSPPHLSSLRLFHSTDETSSSFSSYPCRQSTSGEVAFDIPAPPQPCRSLVLRGQPHLEYFGTSALVLFIP